MGIFKGVWSCREEFQGNFLGRAWFNQRPTGRPVVFRRCFQ